MLFMMYAYNGSIRVTETETGGILGSLANLIVKLQANEGRPKESMGHS